MVDPPTFPDWTLTTEQTRRAHCMHMVLYLFAGRGVPYPEIWRMARWVYNGEES